MVDISKAQALLGVRDRVRPVDALARSLEWSAAHLDETTGADPFDYALEDRVKAALDELGFAIVDGMVETAGVHQIGRATCRIRVSQKEYRSGVAASVEKNHSK